MKLSAYMIVKNEEAHIAQCLARLAHFDEVIVVDTGSTDDTGRILGELADFGELLKGKLKIGQFGWCDDFSAARNYAASLCTGEWLMPIDADNDLISGRKVIMREIQKAMKAGAVSCNIRALYKSGQWHWVSGIHQPMARWIGPVHECLAPAPTYNADITIQIGESKAKASDPDRNLRILLKSDLTVPRNRFYLGKEFYERGRYAEAIAWLRAYLEAPAYDAEIHWAWFLIANCYWRDGKGRGDKAREAGMEALRQNPASKETIRLLAEMHTGVYRERWLRLEKAADNEGVLFVR